MRYVTYTRNESGIVARAHERLTMLRTERVAHYPHREALRGWTESTVFWSRPTGFAVGVAPLR